MKHNKFIRQLIEGNDFGKKKELEFVLILGFSIYRLIQKKQYEAAKSLLEKGATLMIEKKQFNQASELISLLISVYSQSMELGSVGK